MATDSLKKSSKLAIFLLGAILYLIADFFIYGWGSDEKDKAEQKLYKVEKGSLIHSIKTPHLENIDQMIVSTGPGYRKDIVAKKKDENHAVIYKDVNYEGFQFFLNNVIEPYIEAGNEIEVTYVNSLKGIGKLLGFDSDPIAQIMQNRGSSIKSAIGSLLPFLILLGVIVFILRMSGGMMGNKVTPILPKDIDDSLDDLIGMDDIKSELIQLKEMILHREVYSGYGIKKAFNVMMTGPAGTGKTKTARCMAKLLDSHLFYISASSLETGFVGGGAKTLRTIYEKASKLPRSIIFLDEAESVFMSRSRPSNSRHENDTMNALLSLLDGAKKASGGDVIWIVATNFDEYKLDMDEAMLRRFHLKVNFRLPNMRERKLILESLISKKDPSNIASDLNLGHIATITSGMSPAILETLISRAALIAIQESSLISQDTMMKAFERIAVGLTDRSTTGDIDAKRRIIAIHESGHFIAQLHNAMVKSKGSLINLPDHLKVLKISTESVSKMGALGFVLSKGEELPLPSRSEMEEQIIELYGGVANEEIFLGEAGVTSGAHNDIQRVTRLLSIMFNEVGYYSSAKLNFITLKDSGMDATRQRLTEITEKSERLYGLTLDILNPYKELTMLIVERLMDKFIINQDEIIEILYEFFEDHQDIRLWYEEDSNTRSSVYGREA